MSKSIDSRDFTYRPPLSNFAVVADSVSNTLDGNHAVMPGRINPFTGSVENLRSINAADGFSVVPGLGPADEDIIDRAVEHLRLVAPALGLDLSYTPEFVPDPHVKTTSTGERVVNLQQQYRGIP
ncbi:MAG: hypothetical protein ACJ74Q_18030, partial [Pyrinomonadaceae bacterium]